MYEIASVLYDLSLLFVKKTIVEGSIDFDFDSYDTQDEAVTMLNNLLNVRQDAEDKHFGYPFQDVVWADLYIWYTYDIVKGIS